MSENTTPAVPTPEGQMRTRDRDGLAEVLRDHQHASHCIREGHIPNDGYPAHLAELVLASGWLARRDRQVAADAVRADRFEAGHQ